MKVGPVWGGRKGMRGARGGVAEGGMARKGMGRAEGFCGTISEALW